MELQNVTISLPAEILQEARRMAVDQGVSLSRFVAMILEERVEGRRRYHTAMQRQYELMQKGLDLGTNGQISWRREDLHER